MCFELFQVIMCFTVALRAHVLECCANGTRVGALWSPLLHPACMAERTTDMHYVTNDDDSEGWLALLLALMYIGILIVVAYKVARCQLGRVIRD